MNWRQCITVLSISNISHLQVKFRSSAACVCECFYCTYVTWCFPDFHLDLYSNLNADTVLKLTLPLMSWKWASESTSSWTWRPSSGDSLPVSLEPFLLFNIIVFQVQSSKKIPWVAPHTVIWISRPRCRNRVHMYTSGVFGTGARLQLFGSSKNGFGFRQSDLDICMVLEGKDSINVGLRIFLWHSVWAWCKSQAVISPTYSNYWRSKSLVGFCRPISKGTEMCFLVQYFDKYSLYISISYDTEELYLLWYIINVLK